VARDLKKFVNPKFIRTISVEPMRHLLERHRDSLGRFHPSLLDSDDGQARAALQEFFAGSAANQCEGLVADLHRIAELGNDDGMRLILDEARRRGVRLFTEPEPAGDPAPLRHEPKHVALHVYIHHPAVFEAAADFKALHAPTAMAEFRGPDRGVSADLTAERTEAFRTAVASVFARGLQGDYCRLGPCEEDEEISFVVSHGAPVTTTAVVAEGAETIITLREVRYSVLRYSGTEGLLRIGGVPKSQQADVAELFARHILGRPGFFAGRRARDLYTLDPIAEAGPDFRFDHAFDERILDVRIVAAAADLFSKDDEGRWRYVRTWDSKDASGAALRHFRGSEARFGRGWRLAEITFRVSFRSDGKRPSQVTVRLRPPGTLAFRRTRYEKAVLALVARNGLEKDHDAGLVVEAA
jgi:hypothetical protein